MITEPVDMLDQWRRRTGRLVGDNLHVSASPAGKAAFVYTPAMRFEIKSHAAKIGFVPPNRRAHCVQVPLRRFPSVSSRTIGAEKLAAP